MIRIGILGHIGSGKSYVAKQFGYPVFNADQEVTKLYQKNKRCYAKLKKFFPKHITSFPINKKKILEVIIANQKNLKKINKIIHPEIRLQMNIFINKYQKKKFIILDIPLLLENKINKKDDILIFVDSKKKEINKRLKKRLNYSPIISTIFKKIQIPTERKKKKSDFIIKNDFKKNSVRVNVKKILKKILLDDRNNS
jgi:dephospho-CoA kinase|tara:strand:+ start:496 stop:1086 length:591 start_codon:yes stop_codon:yes gene_type:complete